MHKINYFKKFKWEYLVYVRMAPLCIDGVVQRQTRTDKILDGYFSMPQQSYLYLDGDIYYRKSEVEKYDCLVEKNLNKVPKILKLIQRIGLRFAKQESKFNKLHLQKLSNRELMTILRKYFLAYQNITSTLYMPVALDRVLSQILRNHLKKITPQKVTEYFNALTPLLKELDAVKYHSQLLKLAVKRKRLAGNKLDKALTTLAQRYAYLGIKFYYGAPYNLSITRRHWQEVLRREPKKELLEREAVKKEELLKYKLALKKLHLPPRMLKIVQWLQEAIFIRTFRLERLSEGETNSFVLLEEIGRRLGINSQDLINLRFKEIENSLMDKADAKKLIAGRQGPVGIASANYRHEFYFGKDYFLAKKAFEKIFKESVTEISGQAAYQGMVRGKVCIIWTDEELGKIRPGEILVTRMTTPDYIFAMQKAAAIVTDVGGVTSHASVVSRELRKPCVIGTKIATKVLKNGDLVEVDAERGVVRKIK